MLHSGAQLVMKEETFSSKVAHDGSKAITSFVSPTEVFAVAARVVHGGDINVIGKVFTTIDLK